MKFKNLTMHFWEMMFRRFLLMIVIFFTFTFSNWYEIYPTNWISIIYLFMQVLAIFIFINLLDVLISRKVMKNVTKFSLWYFITRLTRAEFFLLDKTLPISSVNEIRTKHRIFTMIFSITAISIVVLLLYFKLIIDQNYIKTIFDLLVFTVVFLFCILYIKPLNIYFVNDNYVYHYIMNNLSSNNGSAPKIKNDTWVTGLSRIILTILLMFSVGIIIAYTILGFRNVIIDPFYYSYETGNINKMLFLFKGYSWQNGLVMILIALFFVVLFTQIHDFRYLPTQYYLNNYRANFFFLLFTGNFVLLTLLVVRKNWFAKKQLELSIENSY